VRGLYLIMSDSLPCTTQYILSLAAQTNAAPLPAVPEVFGIRLPPASECLTAVDFDLVPNKPPPGVRQYDEEVEEIEESESEDEDEDMEPAAIPAQESSVRSSTATSQDPAGEVALHDTPFPISAIQTPSDIDMLGTPAAAAGADDASDAAEEEDGLFAGGDDDDDEDSDAMEEVQTTLGSNGAKRKLVEEDDYD
jgi:transcription initiation factor TFIID subunit 9B